ncbi:protein Wiz-like isoform X2 [Xyrauchen texanus]|uniref:protein Wiz-like isoform X2 n=1 Tax=Xyrauchen texanus TaxID=154827 RepID=UPI002242BD1E|nr:protein Wiz-like isoform X2 [Xyrauchen texanus]
MEKTASNTAKKSSDTFPIECLKPDLNKDKDDLVGVHVCEGCGTNFETRRGLSSHARFHLRQLGVAVSDSCGAPIDLLYQLIKERGGTLPKLKTLPSPVKKSKAQSPIIKKNAGPKLKIKISNLVKKKYAISSSSSTTVKGSVNSGPRSSPLTVAKPRKVSSKGTAVSMPWLSSALFKAVESRLSDASPSTSFSLSSVKPLWAPQETDAPLNLTTMKNSVVRDDVHVCELCGAWYEMRKGLASHARAHLRQFGVNLDSKGAPIDVLHKFIQSEDFQEQVSAGQQEGFSVVEDYTSPSSIPSTSLPTSKHPSLFPVSSKGLTSMHLTPPPKKKKKISLDVSGNLSLGGKAEQKSPTLTKKKKSSPDVSGGITLSGKAALKLPSLTKKNKITLDVSESITLGGKGELKSPTPTKKQKKSSDVSWSMILGGKAELKSHTPTKKQNISLNVSESMTLCGKAELKSPTPTKKQKNSQGVSGSLPLSGNKEIKSPSQGKSSKNVRCQFCHKKFKKRQSLASHARYHLRQLGITEWTVRGSPMATLQEVMARRGSSAGSLKPLGSPSLPPLASPSVSATAPPLPSSPKHITQSSSRPPVPHKVPKARKGSRTVVPTPTDEPIEVDISISESPKPRSTLTMPLPTKTSSNPTTDKTTVTGKSSKNVRCQFCHKKFKRQSLASHARYHLRQLGITEWTVRGSPMATLQEVMARRGSSAGSLKPLGSPSLPPLASPSVSPTAPPLPSSPKHITQSSSRPPVPHKVPKTRKGSRTVTPTPTDEPIEVDISISESPKPRSTLTMPLPTKTSSNPTTDKTTVTGKSSKNVRCQFCHKKFKRQSLASHARYHLRQLGITEWTVRGSPMATLQEVMARRGSSAGSLKPLGSPSLPPFASPSVSPTAPPLPSSPKHITQSSSRPPVPHKVPKARKGSRTVTPTPTDEPIEVDISISESPKPRSTLTMPLPTKTSSNPTTDKTTVTAPKPEEQDPTQFMCCEYCGEMFDSHKSLSCHARGHLRQLGAKWSLKVPPIEALYVLMQREGTKRASETKPEPAVGAAVQWKKPASSLRTVTPSPEKTASENTTTSCDATCELCGFDFENRKALASHARAQLRQQGVDWKINGSPIETLTAWMHSEPGKVAELHKRYMQGHIPFVKKGSKRSSSSPHPSPDSESFHLDSQKASSAARVTAVQPQVSQLSKGPVVPVPVREGPKAGISHSSLSEHRKRPSQGEASLSTDSMIQTPAPRSEFGVCSPRGCEQHLSHRESISGETETAKPSRAGNIPSLVPRPPETSLVKLVGKVYSLKCRFCEEVFKGPHSIQEDWVMHLQQHIIKLKNSSSSSPKSSQSRGPVQSPLAHTEVPLLMGSQAV